MDQKIKIQLGDVQKTLLLPLWGRAMEAQKSRPRMVDAKALEVIAAIDYDFSAITQNINQISQLSWVARSLRVDAVVSGFIKAHPRATIVNLGCGLDTTFDRIDNGEILFYELDLPDVVELRKAFFADSDRHRTIAGSFLETGWFDQVEVRDGLMCIGAGLFYYFSEAQMRGFFKALADNFSRCDVFFDSLSPFGVKMGNKKVLKAGGMSSAATVTPWGLSKAQSLEKWDPRIKVLAEVSFYRGLRKGYPLSARLASYFSDILNICSMIHLRIN